MSTCRPNKDCIVELLVSLLGDQNYWQWQNYKQNQRASSFSDFIFGETILAQYSNSKDLYLKLIEGFLIFTSLKKNFLMLVLKIICCKRCCNVSLTINTHISQKKKYMLSQYYYVFSGYFTMWASWHKNASYLLLIIPFSVASFSYIYFNSIHWLRGSVVFMNMLCVSGCIYLKCHATILKLYDLGQVI